MATFKVGQRVRKIAAMRPGDFMGRVHRVPHGAEGVVTHGVDWTGMLEVQFDGFPPLWGFPYQLAPLTDPGAERFLASLRKLGNEPNILAPQELERVKGGV
jgi:hypothetical protein